MPQTSYSSERSALRWLTALLALAVLALPFPGKAYAEETVQSLSFQDIGTTLSMYAGDERQIAAIASVANGGTSSTKDVTLESAWTTSKSSVVKVDKGMLTALSAGYADITATYRSVSKTVRVTVTYEYDKVEITLNGTPAASPQDVLIGDDPTFGLDAYKGSATTPMTEDAEWSSSNEAIATVEEGKVELAGIGSVTITAKYKGRTDSVKLNVASPYKALSIAPAGLLEFKMGGTPFQLTANAEKSAGTPDNVTPSAEWTSANEEIADVEDGLVRPVGVGTTTVKAEYLGVSKSVTVVVRPAFEAMQLSVDKPIHLLVSDAPVQLRATVADDPDQTPDDITSQAKWESSNVFAVTVTETGSGAGLVTPKAAGTSTITVTYKGATKSIAVTVYPSIASLEIKDGDKPIDGFLDSEESLPNVTGKTLGGELKDVGGLVEWTSADPDIVSIEDGKWVANKLGQTELTARVGSRTAVVDIVIHEKPLALLSSVSDLSIVTGKSAALPDLTLLLANGEEAKEVDEHVTWSTSSPNILVKDEEVKGLLPGKYSLTAKYLGKTATVRVTVEEEIVTIIIDPKSVALNPGKSKSIKVKGFYKTGKYIMLTTKLDWTSDKPEVATVKGSSVRAAAVGTAQLTASYQGKTLTVPVTVTPRLTKLTASVTSLKLAPGASKQVGLTAQYDKKTESSVTASAAWTSSNSDVAVVTGGNIVAVAKGSALIKASFGGKTVSIRVTVK